MKKKRRERKKEFRGKGGKEKKKSFAGFKPVRLVLLVVLSVQREGVVGRIGFTFLPSWATLFAVIQTADSSSPAASLCWVFCLCPRELVGPAGLFAQILGRRCRCGPWQAIRSLISQSSRFGLGTAQVALCLERSSPLALCLGSAQPAYPAALGLSHSGRLGALGLNHAALGSEVLGLWVEQLTSAPDALGGFRCWRPSGVSCGCPQFANPVRATGPQVSAGAAYLALVVLGWRGEGRQGPRLLPRVL